MERMRQGETQKEKKREDEKKREKKERENQRKRETSHRYLERAHECVIHAHHGPCIVELPTVIGCAKDGD